MTRQVDFVKYQGTGNDFIIINALENQVFSEEDRLKMAREMCDRHFGIGSDGLIFIDVDEKFDFYLDFLNPDGSRSFCGNGSRCGVHFYHSIHPNNEHISFNAIDGPHEATINQDEVSISMNYNGNREQKGQDLFIHTGSPHYLRFVDDLPEGSIVAAAREIRYNDEFREEGVNVNFIVREGDGIRMRTYERGVEDETLSCGTGVTAAAIGAAYRFRLNAPIPVGTRGGDLSVHFETTADGIAMLRLSGPAKKVFTGKWIAS